MSKGVKEYPSSTTGKDIKLFKFPKDPQRSVLWLEAFNHGDLILGPEEILYAVGQGALAVECRANDENTIKLLEPLYDLQTALRVTAERSFLKTLGGGCSAPVAVSSELKIEKSHELKITLNGAVWSLDGAEEVKEKDEISITVKNGLRCDTCPYKGNINNQNLEDIENLNDCARCPISPTKEPSLKRQKFDDKVPIDILKTDPHEHCPVQLPIGADFMGKCPYLENVLNGIQSKCPVNGAIQGASTEDYTKCPFLTDGKFMPQIDDQLQKLDSKVDPSNLFCGLVTHKDAKDEGMENARKLGERLAHNLILKGALEIMTNAQSIIHSSIGLSASTSS